MLFTWISKFVPIANVVSDGVNKIISNKKRQEKIEKSVRESILSLYKKQFSSMNRDITLIKSYKPIAAKIQSVDIILRRWEYVGLFCEKNKSENLIDQVVDSKKIELLLKTVESVESEMEKLSGEADIMWNEGGVSLKTALSNLKSKLRDLRTDFVTRDDKVSRIIANSRQSQEETQEFFVFWDEVLKSLVVQASDATEKFVKGLDSVVQDQIKLISKDYPKDDWSKVVSDTLSKIEDLSDSSDDNDD